MSGIRVRLVGPDATTPWAEYITAVGTAEGVELVVAVPADDGRSYVETWSALGRRIEVEGDGVIELA